MNYKYRMHDPRIGRFFAVDPLEHEYSFFSPYQFSGNTPIVAIELEGLESSVELNYSQGSVKIERTSNNQFQVTAAQLSEIGPGKPGGNWNTNTKTYNTNTDNIDGSEETMDIWCSDCDSYSKRRGGAWVTVNFPALEVVRYEDIEVDVEVIEKGTAGIKGTPGTKGTEDKVLEDKHTARGNFYWSSGQANSDVDPSDANVNTVVLNLRTAYYTAKAKYETDGYKFSHSNGLTLYARENTKFNLQVKAKLEKKFGMKVRFEIKPDMAFEGKRVEMQFDSKNVYKKTVPGTPGTSGTSGTSGTPDKVVIKKETRTVPVVKRPVVINP